MLFGVHAVWWHGFTVVFAWRKLYGRWPHWHEFIPAMIHDVSYWGKPNMDGPEGRLHPEGGAKLAARVVMFFKTAYLRFRTRGRRDSRAGAIYYALNAALDTYWLSLYHSREYALMKGEEPSPLCWADKLSVIYEPAWFYILRARLSGELVEFKARAADKLGPVSDFEWLRWYRGRVRGWVEKLPADYVERIRRS